MHAEWCAGVAAAAAANHGMRPPKEWAQATDYMLNYEGERKEQTDEEIAVGLLRTLQPYCVPAKNLA